MRWNKIMYLLAIAIVLMSGCKKRPFTKLPKIVFKTTIPTKVPSASLKKSISVLSKESNEILEREFQKNPRLLDFFEENRGFVSTWDKLQKQLGDDAFSPEFLKLFTKANQYSKNTGNKLENFVFEKIGKEHYVIKGNSSNEVFATLHPDRTIVIPDKNPNNLFTQLKPLPKCKYKQGNGEFFINENGCVSEAKFTVSPKTVQAERSSKLQAKMKEVKYCEEDDVAGHIIGNHFGGPSNMINLVPMNQGVNGAAGGYGKAEAEIRKLVKEGKSINVRVKLDYDAQIPTDRPEWITIEYSYPGGAPVSYHIRNK